MIEGSTDEVVDKLVHVLKNEIKIAWVIKMSILIILEDSNGKIHRMGLESIAGAQKLASSTGLKTSAVVMGSNADALVDEASQFDLGEVIRIKDELLSTYSSDGYAHAVKQIIDSETPAYVLFGHSYKVRIYFPKLSAKLMKPFLADNIALNVDGDTMTLTYFLMLPLEIKAHT